MMHVWLSVLVVLLGMNAGCDQGRSSGPPAPPPQVAPAAAPSMASLTLEDVPVSEAVTQLAAASQLSAVIDPDASRYASCARVTVVVPAPRPTDELTGLVAEALRPSGFTLTRQSGGLLLRHAGSPVPAGCVEVGMADEVPADDTESDAPSLTPEALDRGIRAVSDTEFLIAASEVERLFGDQSLMRTARVVPRVEDGEAVGLRLYGIRSSSLAGRLGIRNGDTLLTVNGRSLASPETALEAYASLRDARRYEVVLDRRGARRTHVYRIVDRLPRR